MNQFENFNEYIGSIRLLIPCSIVVLFQLQIVFENGSAALFKRLLHLRRNYI